MTKVTSKKKKGFDARNKRHMSSDVQTNDVPVVKALLQLGFPHRRIAALLDVNQGRISEINTGKRHSEIPVAKLTMPDGYGN